MQGLRRNLRLSAIAQHVRQSMTSAYSPGPPTAAVVPAGQCIFGESWSPAPLVSKVSVNHDTRVFTFGLSDGKPLGLSTCACILAKGTKDMPVDEKGDPIVRPYTPVSTNAMTGQFQLMVKIYPGGKISEYLDKMAVGDTMDFKHIGKNVKVQHPFNKAQLGMLVGGTGITPMVQALHAVLGTADDATKVSMLYGSKTADDILAKETLDEWCASHGERLSVTHVLSNEAEGSAWKGARGFFTKELIEQQLPAPSSDCCIFVCGPPPMYDALCGPRDKPELTGLLATMGYKADQVFKF